MFPTCIFGQETGDTNISGVTPKGKKATKPLYATYLTVTLFQQDAIKLLRELHRVVRPPPYHLSHAFRQFKQYYYNRL